MSEGLLSNSFSNIEVRLDDPNLGDLEKEWVLRCLDSSYVSTYGPFVPEFESVFADYLGCRSAVALQNGTSGLHISLYELGIGEEDEVILPVLTFIATANAVKYVRAKPVFVDVDPFTWNIDLEKLQDAITDRTRAIIAVHLYGNPSAMLEISKIAEKNGLYVLEDATESLGAAYRGSFTGTIGDFGVFSFNGNKIITTGGGGMIVGADENRLSHIRFLINQARDDTRGYYHTEIGFNYRMTNLEASLGLAQMKRLDEFLTRKRTYYEIYTEVLSGIDEIRFQGALPEADGMRWMNSIIIDTKKVGSSIPELQADLRQKGIPTRRVFMPLVESPPYSQSDKRGFPNAYEIYQNGLCMPSSTMNDPSIIRKAAECLAETLKGTH